MEYAEAFRSAHVALTMRFHSVVFALALDLPTVAIDYTLGKGKVYALAKQFAVPCQSLQDLTSEFIVESVGKLMFEPGLKSPALVPSFSEYMKAHLPEIICR
jgi:polysaccharide pyruvyl transferase WcaK-like protein